MQWVWHKYWCCFSNHYWVDVISLYFVALLWLFYYFSGLKLVLWKLCYQSLACVTTGPVKTHKKNLAERSFLGIQEKKSLSFQMEKFKKIIMQSTVHFESQSTHKLLLKVCGWFKYLILYFIMFLFLWVLLVNR